MDRLILEQQGLGALIDMAVESWRFSKLFIKLLSKLDAGEAPKYLNQYKYFRDKLEQSLAQMGLKLVNLEGHVYDSGMAVKALNMEEFSAQDSLIIDQMLEPIVMGSDGLIRSGTVMLGKAG